MLSKRRQNLWELSPDFGQKVGGGGGSLEFSEFLVTLRACLHSFNRMNGIGFEAV